jgi:Tat protein secretion system quality control protein TatD with DNase activity
MPGLVRKVLIEIRYLHRVQFHKGAGPQFLTRLTEGALRDDPFCHHGVAVQVEVGVQFILERLFDQIHQEQHHQHKRQRSLARERARGLAMALHKRPTSQTALQGREQIGTQGLGIYGHSYPLDQHYTEDLISHLHFVFLNLMTLMAFMSTQEIAKRIPQLLVSNSVRRN